eukprot:TRINITY_DN3231_c0_g1_i2.p1 TRINITY_DN3231_c0_g1~~TRINITY_DN3231_c0_g1_i2.p1  ORF type:complete len:375 (+),score=106.46 TRINITY_DN3231_c0_g1_i2:1247-2371(+)
MDPVKPISNILIIGMTNRKDLIDKALLRPRRFDVKIEVGLPDEKGRAEILSIYTAPLLERIASGVDYTGLAKKMKNFSGAEVEDLVSRANKLAMERALSFTNEGVNVNEEDWKITPDDFERALSEITPIFGVNKEELDQLLPPTKLIVYSQQYGQVIKQIKEKISLMETTPVLRLFSLLLCGKRGSGKSALAATIASESNFPLVRLVTPHEFIGKSEHIIASEIKQIFSDLYRSSLSLLVLDDIERLISYSPVGGSRFSNTVLQSLLVMISKQPPKGRKLFIIATSSEDEESLSMLGLRSCFNNSIQIPLLNSTDSDDRDGDDHFKTPSRRNNSKTIGEILTEIESNRMYNNSKDFESYLQTLPTPFHFLKDVK